jgi:ligand-binding sensor domain-containing protein
LSNSIRLAKTLSSIFLVLLINLANAQQVKRYSFTHHGMQEGLGSNVTSCVAQDNMGYIWIGTNNGLQTRKKTFGLLPNTKR